MRLVQRVYAPSDFGGYNTQASFTETGISEDFHVGHEVSILGISLYVLGLGLGPLLIGPLSEVHGRNPIYRISYLVFFAFSWAVAFPPDIGQFRCKYLSRLRGCLKVNSCLLHLPFLDGVQ